MGKSPTDSVGIAHQQGAERILNEILGRGFLKEAQEYAKQQCQKTN